MPISRPNRDPWLPEDDDELTRLIDPMPHTQKVAFAAGYAQRLLVIFDGVRGGQWQYFADLIHPALEQVWAAAQGNDVDRSLLAQTNADLLANIPNDQDPNLEFTWETEALGSVASGIYAAINVVLLSDTEQASLARMAFTNFLDYVVESSNPTQLVDLAESEFFQDAMTLIDDDVASSATPVAHRALASRQGTQLLTMISSYLGPKPW